MTGIVHESRLTRLLRLREQLDDEITAERVIERARVRRATELNDAAEVRRRQERRDLVPASVVRQWAKSYGHPYPERGRVPDGLVDLYLDAHPEALRQRR